MAALVEGCHYGLSSHESTSADKTVVHVKLTDSALRAIEEFQKIKTATSRKPTIRFHGSNGVISVPKTKSSDDPEGVRSFQFVLSPIQADPNGSFECIQQVDKSSRQELQLLGAMTQKVVIRATDDVYQTTKDRMTLADEESKKYCAKEIKASGPKISHKVKVKPGQVGGQSRSHLSQSLPNPKSSANPAVPFSNKAHSLNAHKAGLNKSAPNPVAFALPVRDRLIHLLAIRSYKKPELHLRLSKDGIREKDKHIFSTTLGQAAVFNPRDNTYSLAKHAYADVRENWPLYTDYDRQLLKRKMAQISEQPPSASTSPALSPCHSNSSQGSPTNSQKRPTSIVDDQDTQPQPKKQRIAHNRKEVQDSPGSPRPHGHVSQHPTSKPTVSNSSLQVKKNYSPKCSPTSPSECQENKHFINQSQQEKVKEEKPDYHSSYHNIRSSEERQRYKADFNSEYIEYRQLHAKMDKKTKIFSELHDLLKQQTKGSEEYENIKNRIFSEYKNVKADPKFIEQRKRCDYLHRKLGHIKKLIADYDNARLQKS